MSYRIITQVVRWSARISATLLVSLLVLLAIGNGDFPPLFRGGWPHVVQTWGLIVTMVGFIIGWRSELVGAALALLGLVAFNVAEFSTNGQLAGGAFPLFAVPVVLSLVAAALARAARPGRAAQ